MKIFLAGFYQETNSFSPLLTDVALFRRGKLLEGAAMLDDIRGANLELAGMVEAVARHFPGAEIVPGMFGWGVAAGPLTDQAFAELSERMLEPLQRVVPVDAVLLSLHGSMRSVSCEDCEGLLLERIRSLVGPAVPVAVSFDFHAVMSAAILRNADLTVGYRTYPHVDMAETGRRTVEALAEWLTGGREARPVASRWSAIVPVDNAQTDSGPMASLMAGMTALEGEPGVLTASVYCAHPWIDTKGQGITLVVYARPRAVMSVGKRLERLLQEVWERRREFLVDCPSAVEFFRRWPAWPQPVAAIDAGDVTTAGAPGDSTEMLRAALAAGGPRVLLPLVDATTVERAQEVGEGRSGEFAPGGSVGPADYNRRVALSAEVIRLTADPVRLQGAAFEGLSVDLGPRALLRVGSVQILVLRHGSWFHDPELWRSIGVNPSEADVIVQKSHKLFRPAYAAIARSVVTVDTAGCTDRQLAELPFRRVLRPVFPLDEMETFDYATVL